MYFEQRLKTMNISLEEKILKKVPERALPRKVLGSVENKVM
jgi:hypothetical protein